MVTKHSRTTRTESLRRRGLSALIKRRYTASKATRVVGVLLKLQHKPSAGNWRRAIDALVDVHYFDLDTLAKKHKFIFSLVDARVLVSTRLDPANRSFEPINTRELGFFEWFNVSVEDPEFFYQIGKRLACLRTLEWSAVGEYAYNDTMQMFFPYLLSLIQSLKRR